MLRETLSRIAPAKLFIWEFGRPAELWLSYRAVISKLITQFKLKPLPAEAYPYLPMAGEAGMAASAQMLESGRRAARFHWPIPFPGGMRIPHLHFDRDVYLVDQKQWNEFSQAVVQDIQKRLAAAKEVGFDQVVQLGESAASLGH